MKQNDITMINEIVRNENLEINLPTFCAAVSSRYYEKALLQLTMNYFTLYEVVRDKENPQVTSGKKIMNSVHSILGNTYLSKYDVKSTEQALKKLEALRNEIIGKMQVLTTYTDILQVYEYVLNRVELRFETNLPDYDETEITKEIMAYIFDSKDNVVVNGKIKEILEQLPIRMTKAKFFEQISNSLSLYKGSDKESLESFLYIIRTSALLYRPEGIENSYSTLSKIVKDLEKADYRTMQLKEYCKLSEKLSNGASYIQNLSDILVALIEIINHLYALLLAMPYAMDVDAQIEAVCSQILQATHERFKENDFESHLDEVMEKFVEIEGKQENISYELNQFESHLTQINENHRKIIESLMLQSQWNGINISQKLLSASYFVDLEEKKENGVVDEEFLDRETRQLLTELTNLFAECSQSVKRGIMANTLSKLPVFFHNSTEVSQYIFNSLSACAEESEKVASIQLIRQIMEF